jgi:hypothetical protein
MSTSPDSVTYPVLSYGILSGATQGGPAGPSYGATTVIMLTALPTSTSGLPVGALWNNGGVVCVVV